MIVIKFNNIRNFNYWNFYFSEKFAIKDGKYDNIRISSYI